MMIKEWFKNLLTYPTVDYPTVLLGYVSGELRWETLGGLDAYDSKVHFLFNKKPFDAFNTTWGVTHLQKKSRFGFLIMKPFALHFWFFWKMQNQLEDGTWVPGSEQGIYRRLALYRWDAGGTYDPATNTIKHWIGIPSIYFNFSLHWD